MAPFLAWLGIAAVATALLLFVMVRLRLFVGKGQVGRWPFLAGMLLVAVGLGWQAFSEHPVYFSYFVQPVYPILFWVQIGALFVGGLLLAIGLALYADDQQSKREDIEYRESRSRVLEELREATGTPVPLVDLLNLTLRELLARYPGCGGALFMINRTQRILVLGSSHSLNRSDVVALEHLAFHDSVVGQALELDEPVIGARFLNPSAKAAGTLDRFESCVVVPLRSAGDRIGALVLLSEESRAFGQSDIRVLRPVTDWLAEKLHAARLGKELTVARNHVERATVESERLANRLQVAVRSVREQQPADAVCASLIGAAGASSVHFATLENGNLNVAGQTEPLGDVGETLLQALVDAVGRPRPLVINQEGTDDTVRRTILTSWLVCPVPGSEQARALILRKAGSGFAPSGSDLRLIEWCAGLAALVVEREVLKARHQEERRGFDRVLQLLRNREPVPTPSRDPEFFIRQIEPLLPRSAALLLCVKDQGATWTGRSARNMVAVDPTEIILSAGEGDFGRVLTGGASLFTTGPARVRAALASLEPQTVDALRRSIGDHGEPESLAVLPITELSTTAAVLIVLEFDGVTGQNQGRERVLSLAAGLYSLRLSMAALSSRPVDLVKSGGGISALQVNELHNHLSAVIGIADLIARRGDLSGDLQAQLELIADEAHKAAQVSRLLQPAESAATAPASRGILLDQIVRQVLQQAKVSGALHMLGGRAREVNFKLAADLPVETDPESLRVCLESALNRFAAYAADDDVITISAYRKNQRCYLDVCRHRKFFPPVEPVADFGGYEPVEQALRNRPGEVYLEQLTGQPCAFAIDSHSATPAWFSIAFHAGAAPSTLPAETSVRRLLAVDDQPIILDLLSAMCRSMGYEVTTALSGEEGLRLFGQSRFDLVLTDLAMPGVSGLEVARRIRTQNSVVPIILVTGWEATLDRAQLAASGINQVLYKPFRIEQLTELIGSAVTRS